MAVLTTFHPEPLDQLRQLPFVTDLAYKAQPRVRDTGYDGKLEIQTPSGPFRLFVEERRSYLSRASVNALIASANRLTVDQKQAVILFAHYLPRPAAENLIAHRVNFADRVGNVHLSLGNAYSWTVLGVPDEKPIHERLAVTPAQLQLLFQFATHPESINWPVRQLETAAGISKSKAAQVRRQLITEGLLVRRGKDYRLGPPASISERLVAGYSQVLRPKLTVGRFRHPEKTGETFLKRLQIDAASLSIRCALTGGPAAHLLQHFYRGEETPLFITPWTRSTPQQLRLLPDREGSVIALRAFGDTVFWREAEKLTVAPPWLIYAELLNATDPRAHDAAEEFRREFLP